MQATELRIGNLVHDQNHYGGGMDIVIDSIDVTSETKWWWDDLQPIRLTEKKLIEFGFVFLKRKDGTQGVYTNGKMNLVVSNSGNIYRMSKLIPYVHRLQNLYFELHDEELTKKQ